METFIPNLVSLLNPSFQVLDKTQTGVNLISRLAKYLIHKYTIIFITLEPVVILT